MRALIYKNAFLKIKIRVHLQKIGFMSIGALHWYIVRLSDIAYINNPKNKRKLVYVST